MKYEAWFLIVIRKSRKEHETESLEKVLKVGLSLSHFAPAKSRLTRQSGTGEATRDR